MEPLAVQIEKAVVQLYGDPSNSDVTAAEKWLISIQESKEVWSVAWQLLERDRVEVQNFGALLLKNKLLKSWNEVPEDQYESLRFQIFQSIMKFSENGQPKMVLTQLCVAMVRYVFHSMPTVWPNAIVSVVHTLSSSQAQANLSGLLELLKVLPEEFEASSDNAFAGKRAIIRSEINKSQSTVFGFIEQILLSNSSLNIRLSALKCLTSWSGFAPLLPELRSLVSLLFQLLHDQQLVNDSIEVLTSLITNEDCYKYPTAVKEFQLLLNSKSDFIQTLLNDTDRDNDLCSMMCVLVTETSVTCVKSLTADINQETTENCEESLETLTLLLRFTTLPGHYPTDEKCSEITFCFWERFLGEIESEEVSKQEFLLEFYEGILVSLVEIFPIKARYPSEEEWVESWSEDEQDEFMRYRDELWDLGESIQLTMHYQFVHHLSLTLSNLFSGQSPPLWQDVEAILFLLQVSAGSITEDTSVFFQSTLSLFPRMPSNNTLAKSALRLLGELAEWFRDSPDVLLAVLPMILDNLSKPTLTASAALAFRDICGDCHGVLANSDISSIVISCQAAFSNPGISSDQCAIMIAAVGLILSSLPLSSLSQPLDILLHSRIENIQTLANGQPSMQTHPLVMKELTILNSFCRHVIPSVQEGEQHPVLTVLIRLWPSLKELLGKWMGDSEVISEVHATFLIHHFQLILTSSSSFQLLLQLG
uniref:Importin N-terminal domain-containing protein n=1 Tax=Amphimedon queenslandica TaxID=400682 RepID=A0A1X7UBK3_AMPQE